MKTRFLLFAAATAMALSFAAPVQARSHHNYYGGHNYYGHHYYHHGVVYYRPYGYFRPVYPVVTGPVLIIRP